MEDNVDKRHVFELKYTDINGDVCTRTFRGVTLPEVFENLVLFLKGCGFYMTTLTMEDHDDRDA